MSIHILVTIVETLGVLLVGFVGLLGTTRLTWNCQFRSVPDWKEGVTCWLQALSSREAQDSRHRWLTRTVLGPVAEEMVFRGLAGWLVLKIPLHPGLLPAFARLSIYGLAQALWVYMHVGGAAQIARRYSDLPTMPVGALMVSLRRLNWHSLVLSAVWWAMWVKWHLVLIHNHANTPWDPMIIATIATGTLHAGWNTLVSRTYRRPIFRRVCQGFCPWKN